MLTSYKKFWELLEEDKSNLKIIFKNRFEFFNTFKLMDDQASFKTVYVDNIHTNKLGNKLIANKIAEKLNKNRCSKKLFDFID